MKHFLLSLFNTVFFPITFYDILARARAEIKILNFWTRKWPTSSARLFDFCNFSFRLSIFSFSFLFAAVIITFDWACLRFKTSKKASSGRGNVYHGVARCSGSKILLWVFHSTLWAFLYISQAPFGRSLWCGHHWKDLFLLFKLSIDDANFGQKWWRQKCRKGQGSSRLMIWIHCERFCWNVCRRHHSFSSAMEILVYVRAKIFQSIDFFKNFYCSRIISYLCQKCK